MSAIQVAGIVFLTLFVGGAVSLVGYAIADIHGWRVGLAVAIGVPALATAICLAAMAAGGDFS